MSKKKRLNARKQDMIFELHRNGLSMLAISNQTGVDRRTVKKVIDGNIEVKQPTKKKDNNQQPTTKIKRVKNKSILMLDDKDIFDDLIQYSKDEASKMLYTMARMQKLIAKQLREQGEHEFAEIYEASDFITGELLKITTSKQASITEKKDALKILDSRVREHVNIIADTKKGDKGNVNILVNGNVVGTNDF